MFVTICNCYNPSPWDLDIDTLNQGRSLTFVGSICQLIPKRVITIL